MLEQINALHNCLDESADEGLYASLIDVLKKELVLFQELKEFLGKEKLTLMKSASLVNINENNAVKENIILKSRILEEVRTNVLKKIARNLDIDDAEAKLTSIGNYAMIEQKQVIEKLKNDLLEIARDIKIMNDENNYLLDASIINIKGSLDFISSLIDRAGAYLDNGKISVISKHGRILRTEG